MSQKKASKNIKKKATINTLRHYFPSLLIKYNQCISKLPKDIKSTDENLMSVFRIMWKINLLLKSYMDGDAVSYSEPRHDKERCIDMETTLKEVYKTIWKLNSLLIDEFHLDT
ncbi:uncharacterized protein LOC132952744 [Metopolophium dirhodum]|uniref:uncharacterized protein LOC132952744 n=1 Tax=Metopolophium dirhodum TaxID=44670 RepID=UPI0029904BEA|nr:uncharacterized protein LOC132952744 [Metopolophium dirhodum]XP_060881141.1 uncharacterized protein LOC132952744 [Metopolophium dirhodum]XP_060881142.1 uncharacterized protein LOC132952744 [Metopolophium dirhodum]